MHHTRKTVLKYRKLNQNDKKASVKCSFCENLATNTTVESTETMWVVPNRVAYDYFEGVPTTGEHYMIVPKRHLVKFGEFTDRERREMFELTAKYEEAGFNVYARSTQNIHRSQEHQHTHLIKLSEKQPTFVFASQKPYFMFHL